MDAAIAAALQVGIATVQQVRALACRTAQACADCLNDLVDTHVPQAAVISGVWDHRKT